MPTDEPARRQLYDRLDAVLGPAEAATLMSHLSAVDAGDVASRNDVERLRAALDREATGLRHELGQVRADLDRRFGDLDDRTDTWLAALDTRAESRFVALDARFATSDARFEGVDRGLALLDRRLESSESRVVAAVLQSGRTQSATLIWVAVTQLAGLGGLLLAAVRL